MSENSVSMPTFVLRAGSKHGTKHARLGINNQDAHVSQSISIPALNKIYHVGVVSDGCTGQPTFSHTEVGAHLIVLYAYRRIQELICSGVKLDQIPQVLYPSLTEFMLDLTNKVMPSHVVWNYPIKVRDRDNYNGSMRFRADYLAATIVGFVCDDEDLVVFSAGDGAIVVNDDLTVINQDDKPDYPVISVNKPGKGFSIRTYRMSDVRRVAVSSDGLKELLQKPEFREKLFSQTTLFGLQTFLNITSNELPALMQDDCTAVTLVRQEPNTKG